MDEFVVFVPFVIIGETVEAEITEVKKNFARAKLLRVVTPSPERVAPECRYFGACGGCQYQHIDYAAQLRFKHKQIADLFERVGKISPEKIAPVLPCPSPYGYRNRIMIRSQWNGPAKKLEIGFIRADNNFVEDIEECKIAEPALNEQITARPREPAAEGRHQGGAARAAGELGGAARFVFPEQFFPAAEAGRDGARIFAGRRRAAFD